LIFSDARKPAGNGLATTRSRWSIKRPRRFTVSTPRAKKMSYSSSSLNCL
jgi:hypothetical protein